MCGGRKYGSNGAFRNFGVVGFIIRVRGAVRTLSGPVLLGMKQDDTTNYSRWMPVRYIREYVSMMMSSYPGVGTVDAVQVVVRWPTSQTHKSITTCILHRDVFVVRCRFPTKI